MKPMDTYTMLEAWCKFANKRFFDGKLSDVLITLHRHKNAYGYFCADRFGRSGTKTTVHEIAINPQHIRTRKPRDTFATLLHEQVHQWQQERGKPPKTAYHNKEWAAKMITVGLHPSDTGAPGGKQTGRYVSHYVVKGGAFDDAFEEFQKTRDLSLFGDLPMIENKKGKTSKYKFECSSCGQNAWAKKSASLICGECFSKVACVDSEED